MLVDASAEFGRVVEAGGGAVMPGLVDGHTHPVWAGDRVNEFGMKLAGATYMEVHAAGGGIHSTVERTRAATEAELVDLLVTRLTRMLRAGTTTAECKAADSYTDGALFQQLIHLQSRLGLNIDDCARSSRAGTAWTRRPR